MSQYITISTPADEIYQKNRALICIISFLGKKYKETHMGSIVQMKPDQIVGMDYINKACGKWYKNTIRNLMESKEKSTVFKVEYQRWKINKYKAEKFFCVLCKKLIKEKADKEIWDLFDCIYSGISDSLPIERRGSHIIAYPYRSALNHAINCDQYSQKEKESIAKIINTFPLYDSLYHDKKE